MNKSRTLLTNIRTISTPVGNKPIAGAAMAQIATIPEAYILISGERIMAIGPMEELIRSPEIYRNTTLVHCENCCVLPAFVDSHTHAVFGPGRESEFVDRIRGYSYAEIAQRGGGILQSAAKLQQIDEKALCDYALPRVIELMSNGSTVIEIKSGYGLTIDAEMKILRVARSIAEQLPITIKTTLLGAHAIPVEYQQNRQGYLQLVCEQMIPRAVDEGLADYVDVFCEAGFFTPQETEQVLAAGLKYGLKGRVHANQMSHSGGILAGIAQGALSVDHLEYVSEADIAALLASNTLPTLLPAAAFFLSLPYPPARQLIDAGLPVVLATDFNPGSSPTTSMPFVMALACIVLRMLPEEALTAATINGAASLELAQDYGSVEVGKYADFIITKPGTHLHTIPYYFNTSAIGQVYRHGARVY
jgi:imidazolonepropionase